MHTYKIIETLHPTQGISGTRRAASNAKKLPTAQALWSPCNALLARTRPPGGRSNVSVLRVMRSPSTAPNTTSLQHLGSWGWGYVQCLRSRDWSKARLSAQRWARTLATTSIRHPTAYSPKPQPAPAPEIIQNTTASAALGGQWQRQPRPLAAGGQNPTTRTTQLLLLLPFLPLILTIAASRR